MPRNMTTQRLASRGIICSPGESDQQLKVCQICFLQIGADFEDKILMSSFAATYDNWISLEKYIYMYLTYVFYEKKLLYMFPF